MRKASKRVIASLALAASAVVGTPQAASAAATWGLVIGVDDYQHVNKLEGAVNDAADIAQALRKMGAKDVKLLTNLDASHTAITAAWADITKRAQPGDTVLLSFAGHGAETRGPDGAPRQFVVLPGFESNGAGWDETIFDAEFGQMLRAVPQLNVVFVIDSCHAGTMTRAYGKRRFNVRAVTVPGMEDASPAAKSRALPANAKDVTLPNVVHLGAVQPSELDPEVIIANQPRGALSYAMARAIEGAADTNHDKVLQSDELQGYVSGVIATITDGEQHPKLAVRPDWGMPISRDASVSAASAPAVQTTPAAPAVQAAPTASAAPAVQASAAALVQLQPVSLAILNPGDASPESIVSGLKGARVASDTTADLVWDVARGEITSHLGDVVSYSSADDATRAFSRANAPAAGKGSAAADLPRVQKVVDKMALVAAIKVLAVQNNLTMGLAPDDKVHHAGAQIAFTIEGHSQTYLTLFNLASDGTVNFLYPQDDGKNKDPLQIPAQRQYRLDLKAQAPFGADHLVAITSGEPLTELHKQLLALDNTPSAAKLTDVLSKSLTGKTYQIGVHPSFTAP